MRAKTFLLTIALLGVPAAAAAQDNTVFAQQRFNRGSELYEQHDYAHALDEFRASLALYGSPNARLYLARCLRELSRFDEAVPEFERAMREAGDRAASDPRYVPTRDAANSERLAIEPRIGRLTLTVPEVPQNAVVRVNDREIPHGGLGVAMAVMPGHVVITVEAPEFFPERREGNVSAGGTFDVGIPLRRRPVLEGQTEVAWRRNQQQRPPARGGVPRSLAWVGVGVGGAGLLGFAVFGLLAQSRFDDINSRCGASVPCSSDDLSRRDGGRTLTTVANVSLGFGIAGAVAATVLYLVGRPAEERRPAPTVTVGLGSQGVSLGGVF